MKWNWNLKWYYRRFMSETAIKNSLKPDNTNSNFKAFHMKTKGKDTGGVILQFANTTQRNNFKVNIIKNIERNIVKDRIQIEEFIPKSLMLEKENLKKLGMDLKNSGKIVAFSYRLESEGICLAVKKNKNDKWQPLEQQAEDQMSNKRGRSPSPENSETNKRHDLEEEMDQVTQ